MRAEATVRFLALALLGSTPVFAGWVLAIIPAFQRVQSIARVLVVTVAAFGLVLIPSGAEFLGIGMYGWAWWHYRTHSRRVGQG